jgi:hypothetical protein
MIPLPSTAFAKVPLLTMLIIVSCIRGSLSAEIISIWGTLSNNVYFSDGVRRDTRIFTVSSDGADASLLITNPATGMTAQTTWKAGDRFYNFQLTRTNNFGAISNVSGARIDHTQTPLLDGSYAECVWLPFASHSYFTNRTNDSALPIWPTGIPTKDEGRIGTRAFYGTLTNSIFPSEVAYVTDGFEHFIGSTAGMLQSIPLRSPLRDGFTNYFGHTIIATNMSGHEVPLKFEIFRYGPALSGPDRYSALVLLSYHVIEVIGISIGENQIEYPRFGTKAAIADTRTVTSTSAVRLVIHSASSNIWPTVEQTEKMQKQKQ